MQKALAKNSRNRKKVGLKNFDILTRGLFPWYNIPVYQNTGVCTMDNDYGFLFKKSSLPRVDLNSLLLIEEFVREADRIMSKGNGIEDQDIYDIVKKIYFPKVRSGERSGVARRLNKAMRHFSQVLYGDDSYWEKEYEEFI